MTDHNRGAYTPQSEAPLAFDARRTRGSGDRPLPLTLLISAGILAVIVIALLVFLLRQPDGSDVASTEGATIDAMKTGPEAATPVTEPRPGLQVYTEGQPLSETPAFAPPPEQPGLRPTMPVAAPTVPAAPAAVPVAKAKPAPNTDPLGALTVAAAPKPAAAPKAAATPAPIPTAAASGAGASVQIGAFSSPALAEQGWNDVARLLPGQMAGKTKRVEPIERDGTTLQRAFVGGFASRADAEAFCSALQSRGKTCLVRN